MIVAWRCAVCGTTVDVAVAHAFRCPRATVDDPHHVLHPLDAGPPAARRDDPNPFVAYGPRMAWWAFARANGMTDAACVALARDVTDGFAVTPFAVSPALGDDLGVGPGSEVWVKDETGNVGGSHKGRHLVGILLHLEAAAALGVGAGGAGRRPLAIASCGNAAIAAATLAARRRWPLEVFVPAWAPPVVLAQLDALGASITTCPRHADDPPGDPAVARFRAAVAGGAIPFSVQGTENGMCLDGGRTIGWEMADGAAAAGGLDRAVVQVGGGAFAACVGWGLGAGVRLDTVQTEGCAPLARAWQRAAELGVDRADSTALGARWAELMTPWPDPRSAADGILDDETYDWLADVEVMHRSGGRPLVVPEAAVARAHALCTGAGAEASPTGTAGVAGLLVGDGAVVPGERVAVVLSGIARP